MFRTSPSPRVLLVAAAAGLAVGAPATPQATLRSQPRPEAIAETRLLMQGINAPNFLGLDRQLRTGPRDDAGWGHVAGQALLIAENGNLLLLRPPQGPAQETWLDRAADLRAAAKDLAQAAVGRDFERSRTGLGKLADSCNRCHQSFHVAVRVTPLQSPPIQSTAATGASPRAPPTPAVPPIPPIPSIPPLPTIRPPSD